MIDRSVYSDRVRVSMRQSGPLKTQLCDVIVCPKACLLFYYTLKSVYFSSPKKYILQGCSMSRPIGTQQKCNMFPDQHLCWSWNNIPINQSEFRDKFTGNVHFSLTTRVRCCFYTLAIQLSFRSDFRVITNMHFCSLYGHEQYSYQKTPLWNHCVFKSLRFQTPKLSLFCKWTAKKHNIF